MAVGAICGGDGCGCVSGRVKVYEYDDDAMSWNQMGSSINGEDMNDSSGNSVALSSDGKTLAIGVCQNNGNGPDSGQVKVYHRDGEG